MRVDRLAYRRAMFLFFSNRFGVLGSIAISVVASVALILLVRSCAG